MPDGQISDKPRCGAKVKNVSKRNPDGLCTNFPIRYSKRCRLHGSANPDSRAAAERARIEDAIGKAVQRLNIEPVENPLLALQSLAGEVVAWKDICRQQLHGLKTLGYEGITGEQVRAQVLVWERALDRCITVLATLAKLNIDERLARIEERQAEMVEQAFSAAMEELGIGIEQRAEAARVYARRLRLVDAENAA